MLRFAATAGSAHQLHLGALVVPPSAWRVIASRTILGWVPDRVDTTRTLSVAVLAEATGLVGVAVSSTLPVTVCGHVLLALGEGLAAPRSACGPCPLSHPLITAPRAGCS